MIIEITDKDNSVMLDVDEVLWIMEVKEKKSWFGGIEDKHTLIRFKNGAADMICDIPYSMVRKALDKFCPIHIGGE